MPISPAISNPTRQRCHITAIRIIAISAASSARLVVLNSVTGVIRSCNLASGPLRCQIARIFGGGTAENRPR